MTVRSADRRVAATHRDSADVILQLLDHLRGMAQADGHPDMAGVLDDAYSRCARMEADRRRTALEDSHRLQ